MRVRPAHLRYERHRAGLTQQALADNAGVGEDTVCRLERGQGKGRISTLKKLADALGVPVEAIAELDPPPTPEPTNGVDERAQGSESHSLAPR